MLHIVDEPVRTGERGMNVNFQHQLHHGGCCSCKDLEGKHLTRNH